MTNRRRRNGGETGQQYVTRAEFHQGQESNAENFGRIESAINALRRELANVSNRGTDWRPIGIMVTLATFILGGFGAVVSWGLISQLSTMNERTTRLEDTSLETLSTRYTDDDGDRDREQMRAEVLRLESRIQDMRVQLDESLQREMRLLDDNVAPRIDAIASRLGALEVDLASRAGNRWNRPDHFREVQPVLDELRTRTNALEVELARRASTIERVEREQNRRTDRVNSIPDPPAGG